MRTTIPPGILLHIENYTMLLSDGDTRGPATNCTRSTRLKEFRRRCNWIKCIRCADSLVRCVCGLAVLGAVRDGENEEDSTRASCLHPQDASASRKGERTQQNEPIVETC